MPQKSDKGRKLSFIARIAGLIPQNIEVLLKEAAEARSLQIAEWRKDADAFAKIKKEKVGLIKKKSFKTTVKTVLALFWAPIFYDTYAEVAACVILDETPADNRVFEFYTQITEYKKKLSAFL